MKLKRLLSLFFFLMALSFLPALLYWTHQKFVVSLNPFAGTLIMFLLLLLSFFIAVSWYRWLKEQLSIGNKTEPAILFAMGILCLCITIIISWIVSGDTALDIHLHHTYYVVSKITIVWLISIPLGFFSLVYYYFPRLSKIELSQGLSRFHFWITYIGLVLLFNLNYSSQAISAQSPDLVKDYYLKIQFAEYFNRYVFFAINILLIAQVVFLFNIIHSVFRGSQKPTEG